jgi:hypothetical protein
MTTSEGTTAAAAEPATPDAATIVADDIAAVIWVRERLWRPLEPADQAKLQHLALRLVRADTSEVLRFWGLLAQAVLAYHYRDLKTAFPNALAARDIAVWHYRSGGLLKPEPGIAAMAPATTKAAIGIGADPTWAVLSTCLVADIHRLTQDERGTERELDRAGRFAERHPMLEALVTLYEGRNMLLHGDPGCAAGRSETAFQLLNSPAVAADPHWVAYAWAHYLVGQLAQTSHGHKDPRLGPAHLERYIGDHGVNRIGLTAAVDCLREYSAGAPDDPVEAAMRLQPGGFYLRALSALYLT